MLTRRRLLQAAGASVVLRLSYAAAAVERGGVDLKLGVQLWTVKDDLQRDYAGTLHRLSQFGVQRVELYELGGRPAAEVRDAIRGAGLECLSAHVRLWELEPDVGAQIERAHAIGIRTLVVPVPWLPPDSLRRALQGDMLRVLSEEMTDENWRRTAELLNRYGAELSKAGLQLAYHNHNIDFRRIGDRTAYEALVAATDPTLVKLELDCGWVASAGLDPVTYLQRWPQRYMALHVKDVKAGYVPNFAMQTVPIEVGSGIMNWPAILDAAYRGGVREFYIEQEAPFVRPPLESVKISVGYVAALASRMKAPNSTRPKY
jgi:sugar phosphate isomerase/epimerase